MNWSIVLKGILGTNRDVDYPLEHSLVVPSNAKKLKSIKCFAVAQGITEPFSIYPVIFKIISNDVPDFVVVQGLAVPHIDYIVDLGRGSIKSSDVYIVSCDIELNLQLQGGEQFVVYAQPINDYTIAPITLCVFEGES